MNRTTNGQMRSEAGARSGGEANALVCPACGAAARRRGAHFCATCGRGLKDDFYAPADSLLASYHLQHTRPAILFEPEPKGIAEHAAFAPSPSSLSPSSPPSLLRLRMMFAPESNTAAAIALIMVFSALVPFIGILFCPFAILVGGFGLLEARFVPRAGGSRLAVCCIVFGFLIAGAQVLLWSYI